MRRKSTKSPAPKSPAPKSPAFKALRSTYASEILGGVLVFRGIGIGIAFSSTATLDVKKCGIREVDRYAPNPENLCAVANAMVMDAPACLYR